MNVNKYSKNVILPHRQLLEIAVTVIYVVVLFVSSISSVFTINNINAKMTIVSKTLNFFIFNCCGVSAIRVCQCFHMTQSHPYLLLPHSYTFFASDVCGMAACYKQLIYCNFK